MQSAPDISGLDAAFLTNVRPLKGATAQTWPVIGTDANTGAYFELARQRAAIVQQYLFGAVFVVFGLGELIFAKGPVKLLGFALMVIGPLLIFSAGKVNKRRPGLTLTPSTVTYHDGFGAITLRWSDIRSIETHAPPLTRLQGLLGQKQQVMGIHANPEAVMRTGRATRQTAMQAKVVASAELILLPWTLDGGQSLMVSLMAWCSLPTNRETIGTEVGRSAFWSALKRSSS